MNKDIFMNKKKKPTRIKIGFCNEKRNSRIYLFISQLCVYEEMG